jgi:hypothetical protein
VGTRSEQYHRNADRCEECARQDRNFWLRDEYIRMAGHWRKLAQAAEELEKSESANGNHAGWLLA